MGLVERTLPKSNSSNWVNHLPPDRLSETLEPDQRDRVTKVKEEVFSSTSTSVFLPY